MRKCGIFMATLFGALQSTQALAYNIGTSGASRGIDKFEKFIQDWVSFFSGPFGVAVVVGSIILAVAVFVFAPKQGAMGLFARAVVAGVVILNLGSFMGGFV